MINSGITRRIDDLGRIVLPKELRNNLGIRDGEPLLIETENNNIIIKKYSKVETLKEKGEVIVKIVNDICHLGLLITDREKVIISKLKTVDINVPLEIDLKKFIDNRETYVSKELEIFFNLKGYFVIVPIINCSDSIGLVIIYGENDIIRNYLDIGKIISQLIIS